MNQIMHDISSFLSTFFDRVSDGVYVIDTHYTYLYINKKAAEQTGKPREDLLGKSLWELFPAAKETILFPELQRALEEQRETHFEVFYPAFHTWYEQHCYPSEIGLIVLVRDITERKRQEEQQHFQATILANIQESVIATDLAGSIIYWNEGAEHLFGYCASELLGKTLTSLYPTQQRDALQADLQDILAGRDYLGEWEGRHKDGTAVWVDIRTTLLRTSEGQAVGFLGLAKDVTRRKQAEARLHRQAALLDLTTEAILVRSFDGLIRFWNKGAERLYGFSQEEAIGQAIQDLLHPCYPEPLDHLYATLLQTGSWQGELRHTTKDGRQLVLECHKVLVTEDDGSKSIMESLRDITQRKAQEEALYQSQAYVRRLIDANIIGIVVADMNGIFEANDAFLDMLGYSREDVAARRIDWVAMTPPEFLARDMQGLEELREKGTCTPFEKAYYRKDGSLVPVLIGAAVVNQDPLQWVCFILDISEQKHLEHALRASEERTRLALKGGGITVYQQDRDLRYTWIYNPLPEYTPEDIVGKTDVEFIEADEAAHLTTIKRRVMETGQSHHEVIKATGIPGERYFALSIEPLRDGNGNILGITGTARDVTEQRALEQRKDDFINMASHELKTPITTLSAYMQMLSRNLERQGVQEPLATLIKMDAQVKRLVKLIDELLDAAKIQADHLDYAQESVDLDALVRETVEPLQASSSTHILHVNGTTNAIIQGDKDRLEQVFTNLITNAIKYSPDANKVEIRLSRTKQKARVSVRDYGVGIDASHQQHLFERFYRAYETCDTTFKGLGMGLYIAHNIVQQHGGNLTVKSQKGKGSTFTVSLPVKSD